MSIYEHGLEKQAANYTALTPLGFLQRSAQIYPEHCAIVHGDSRTTWAAYYARCRRLASALRKHGIQTGDTVAAMLPNTPPMLEAHFGVPMAGAVLNTLNTRLDASAIAFMLKHGEAKAILVDSEFAATMAQALAEIDASGILVLDVIDPLFRPEGATPARLGSLDYEAFLAQGDPDFDWQGPADEWQAICLNYTSGTTGDPKGVVYHHRGAYTNAISNILEWDMQRHPVYLWTLPLFHCNGWCFPWTIAARAGTHICLRKVEAAAVFDAIRTHGVTHFCAAPIVHNMLINAPAELRAGITHTVRAMVAGAAPPAAMIEGMEAMGIELTHVYGLTEVYGPATVCVQHPEWQNLDVGERARLNARQGVRYHLQSEVAVLDPVSLQPVAADGQSIGEIMFRGNITMKGYLKNPQATQAAFAGGWFHSGDLAVCYPDGYIKIKDRSKDIIISGGENISSIEVEDVLYRHPAVMAAAVVAMPDSKWGETPCAFIETKAGASVSSDDIIAHCKQHLAGFKVPRNVVFGELPKTSTGKIQKFTLREKALSNSAINV